MLSCKPELWLLMPQEVKQRIESLSVASHWSEDDHFELQRKGKNYEKCLSLVSEQT